MVQMAAQSSNSRGSHYGPGDSVIGGQENPLAHFLDVELIFHFSPSIFSCVFLVHPLWFYDLKLTAPWTRRCRLCDICLLLLYPFKSHIDPWSLDSFYAIPFSELQVSVFLYVVILASPLYY